MKSTIRQIALAIAVAIIFTLTSCIPDEPEQIIRTPEMEQAEIDEVLAQVEEAGLNIDTTDLGVYYITDTVGPAPFPSYGDTLAMRYTGYFLDGYVFDASSYHQQNIDGIWRFIFEKDALIEGFEDGIKLLSKGTKLNMIIPSDLAYGAGGSGSIPPYTPLRFEAEMVDLKPILEP